MYFGMLVFRRTKSTSGLASRDVINVVVVEEEKSLFPVQPKVRSLGSILVVSVLHISLFLAFSLWVSTFAFDLFFEEYIIAQFQAHDWREENEIWEHTYYRRQCNSSDITATDISELVFTDDMRSEDALELFNKHGSIVLPGTISAETATELREFILSENAKNDDHVSIFNRENRWSFAIGIDQHPSISKAMKELLSNERFIAAIEKVVGKNPAITEMTAITAKDGAHVQVYHTDSGPGANRYSRSFFPSYSFFTPLQNTTKRMGATDICAGTHMCSDDQLNVCDEFGISAAGRDDNWPVGWSALTSQQTFHRGAAHTDSDAPHRVVFYLTFAPRPRFGFAELETRTFARGGTYGQKWSQWGHTLRDYQDPERFMSMPWRLLRTWGIYKPAGRQWGWDYMTLTACSLPTSVYHYDIDDLTKMIDNGGLPILPRWLQVNVNVSEYAKVFDDDDDDDDGKQAMALVVWLDFLAATIQRCRLVFKDVYLSVLVINAVSMGFAMQGRTNMRSNILGCRILCLVFLHIIVLLSAWALFQHIDNGTWAKSIKAGKLYELSRLPHIAPDLPETIPTVNDVLILDDMRSDYLASFSSVLDTFQPGNRAFGLLISSRSRGFDKLPPMLQSELCTSMLRWSRQQGSRVLVKNSRLEWSLADDDLALRFCHKEAMKMTNEFLREAIMLLDYLIAETKFGYWRETQMHQKHIPRFLTDLQDQIMNFRTPLYSQSSTSMKLVSFTTIEQHQSETMFPQFTSLVVQNRQPPDDDRLGWERIVTISQEDEVGPSFPQAWLKEGDLVEATEGNRMGEWYVATITAVNSDLLTYDVRYENGEKEEGLCRYCVRPFEPYQVGELVEYMVEGDGFQPGRVVDSFPDEDEYSVVLFDNLGADGEIIEDVGAIHFRRIEPDSDNLVTGTKIVARHPDDEELYDEEKMGPIFWYRGYVESYDEMNEAYRICFLEDEFAMKSADVEKAFVRPFVWAD